MSTAPKISAPTRRRAPCWEVAENKSPPVAIPLDNKKRAPCEGSSHGALLLYADATLRDSSPAHQTSNDRNGKQHNRDEEYDLGGLDGDAGNPAKAKQCGNERNDQKGNGPTQHGGPPCF